MTAALKYDSMPSVGPEVSPTSGLYFFFLRPRCLIPVSIKFKISTSNISASIPAMWGNVRAIARV